MVNENPRTDQPQRPIIRVSMVPLHSVYPRAPYTSQKNTQRSTTRLPSHGVRSAGKGHDSAAILPEILEVDARSGQTESAAQFYSGHSQDPRAAARSTSPSTPHQLERGSHVPSATVITSSHAPVPTPRTSQQPRRAPGRDAHSPAGKGITVGKTLLTIIAIIVFFNTVLPYIVDTLFPDSTESSIGTRSESDVYDQIESELTVEPPTPIPIASSLDLGTPLPPEQSGSRETPASVGQRLVVKDVAITVISVERGENAVRRAHFAAPPGYEYVLLHLKYENPDRLPIDLTPIIVNENDEGYYPKSLMSGVDFRIDAEPDENGTTAGEVLFLVKSDELHTLTLHSYEDSYPVLFFALP